MLTDQTVLILNERITEVGAAAQVRIPADARVIDLRHETVLLGLMLPGSHRPLSWSRSVKKKKVEVA